MTRFPKDSRTVGSKGYWLIRVDGVWRLEHRVIAERVLGRRLKRHEEVHHINGDRLDNDNRNLLVCTALYHQMLHVRMMRVYQQRFPNYRVLSQPVIEDAKMGEHLVKFLEDLTHG